MFETSPYRIAINMIFPVEMMTSRRVDINTWRPKQKVQHFVDDISKYPFFHENASSLVYIHQGLLHKKT